MIQYKRFVSLVEQTITGFEIVSNEVCFDYLIQETSCGNVLVNREQSQYKTVKEARDQIKQQRFEDALKDHLKEQSYQQISEAKVAEIIRKHNSSVKITDTLIEKCLNLASSKSFTTDSTVLEIRNLSEYNNSVSNKIHYILEDGSSVYIDKHSQDIINNIFGQYPEVINYMKQDSNNFVNVVGMLEE